MNKSTNYKIQKYSYKLEHAKNKTEASLYKAKLDSYTSKQKGGRTDEEKEALKKKYNELIFSAQIENNDMPLTEENLKVMLDYNFLDTEEEIKKLEPLLKQRLADFLKECCPKGESSCPTVIAPKVEQIKQLWIELIDKVSKSKQSDVSNLVKTESDKIMALFKCEKTEGKNLQQDVPVAQAATLSEEYMKKEEERRQELLRAAKATGESVDQLVQGVTIPTVTGELGEDLKMNGGKKKRRSKKN